VGAPICVGYKTAEGFHVFRMADNGPKPVQTYQSLLRLMIRSLHREHVRVTGKEYECRGKS